MKGHVTQLWDMQKPVKVLGKTMVPGKPAKTSADKQCVHSILGVDGPFLLKKVGIGQFLGYSVNSLVRNQ